MKTLDYGKNYFHEGMAAPRFYPPVARGLEIKIGEKRAVLREKNRDPRGG